MKDINVLMYAIHQDPRGFIGGGFIRTYEVLKRGKKHGINYFVVEPKKSFKRLEPEMNYKCYEINCDFNFYNPKSVLECTMKALKRGLDVIKKHNIDLVCSPVEVHPSNLLPYFTYLLTGVPWTITLQSLPLYGNLIVAGKKVKLSLNDMYSRLRKLDFSIISSIFASCSYLLLYNILRKCPKILVTSRTVVQDFRIIDPLLAKRLYVIYPGNAIDQDIAESLPSTHKIYDAVFVSSYDPRKGLNDIIDIWYYITREKPSAKLAIMGKVGRDWKSSQKVLEKLKHNIAEKGLEQNITFVGDLINGSSRHALLTEMKKGKILLYPSTLDSWGLIVGEALACGLPVVAYDTLAVRTAYGNSNSIFFVPVGNKKMFAKVASLLMENSLVKKYGREAAKYIKTYYSWDKVVQAEKAAYFKVLEAYRYGESKF